jgi:hypothetical protein
MCGQGVVRTAKTAVLTTQLFQHSLTDPDSCESFDSTKVKPPHHDSPR